MSVALPVDIVERTRVLREVEQGLFNRPISPTLFGRFVILKRIGEGGGGIVYAAFDPQLDRKVAIKLLHVESPGAMDTAQSRLRLLREAQALAQVSHPGVVAVYDVGTFTDEAVASLGLPDGANGIYLVMELVDGMTLAQWLQQCHPSRAKIIAAFIAAGRGIAAAHAHGIVHRDIKPSNIVIDGDGRVRVLDFGLARPASCGDTLPQEPGSNTTLTCDSMLRADLSGSGTVVGTPRYMAPEQHQAGAVTPRADQYSFCVSLYEALCGRAAFHGIAVDELLPAKQAADPTVLPDLGRLPRWLRRALSKGLDPRPDNRFESMDALLAELERQPRRMRQRLAVGGVAILSLAGLGIAYDAGQARACESRPGDFVGIWDDEVKAEIQAHFEASSLSFAKRTWENTRSTLDQYRDDWLQTRDGACRATLIDQQLSTAELSRVLLCLDQGLQNLAGVTEVLLNADESTIERTPHLLTRLPRLQTCSSEEDIANAKVVEHTPEQRRILLDLERLVGRAEALVAAVRVEDAVAAANRAISLAERYELPRFSARARRQIAESHQIRSEYGPAISHGRLALEQAELADDEILSIELMTFIGLNLMLDGQRDEARAMIEHTQARAAKLHSDSLASAFVFYVRARIDEKDGEYDDALNALHRALTIRERSLGPNHPDSIQIVNMIGVVFDRMGLYDDALEHYIEVSERLRAQLGEHHPKVANAWGNIGSVLELMGRHEESIPLLERSIASYEATFGPEHAMIYWYSSNLGWSLLAQGYPSAGLIALQRALQGRRKSLGERHPETLHSALALGSAHICVGDHREALLQMSNLAAAEEADVNTRVQALRLSGVAAIGLGRLEEAERRLREALSNLDDREGEHDLTRALILGQLARAQWLAGKASAARVTLKAAFELVEHNDPQLRDVLDLYVTMGQVHWNRDWQYARQYLDAAIAAATIEEPDSCHLVDATQWFTAGVESVKTR